VTRIGVPVGVDVRAVGVRAEVAVEVRDAATGHGDAEDDSNKDLPEHAAKLHGSGGGCRLR
jgi:hypothetical protein